MARHLLLYRRHSRKRNADGSITSLCVHGHEQDHRTFEPVIHKTEYGILKVCQPTKKTDQRKDCNCPIVADGSLEHELGRIRYRSLDTSSWDDAITKGKAKLESGTWKEPIMPTPAPEETFEHVTVEKAVELFLKSIDEDGENLSDSNQNLYRVLLEQRLIPFCKNHQPPVRFIATVANPTINEEFTQSWKLLPRFKGDRKAGQKMPIGSKITYLQRWQRFLDHCLEKEWITKVPKIKMPVDPRANTKKPSLKREELDRVEHEANIWSAKHRWRRDHRAADIQLAFMLFKRTGMRSSDVVTLAHTDIVWFGPGNCYAIEKVEWKLRKKGTILWHPLDTDVYEALMAHGFRGSKDGKRYFLWSGKGKEVSAMKNLRRDIDALIRWAQDPDPETGEYRKPFGVEASSHTLRHTYGQLLWDSGKYSIDVIAELMGHARYTTTQKYYVGKTDERKATLVKAVLNQHTPNPDNVIPMRKGA
jgi:integrase